MDIFKSVWDRFLGLGYPNPRNEELLPTIMTGGAMVGKHPHQIRLPGPKTVVMFDDFLGDVVADQWNFTEGTDSGTSDGAIVEAVNGTFVLTPGDSAGTVAGDYAQLNSALQWKANAGGLALEAKIKLAAITSVSCFVGFTDTKALEQPIYSAGSVDTITTDATDAVGFMFDTAMTTGQWHLVGVKADVDASKMASGVAPVAGAETILRVEVDTDGSAEFYIDGNFVGTGRMANAVTPTVALTPHYGIRPKSAVAGKLMTIDYAYTAADRA